ncbi:MAG TPA: D-alanine--D-alanine ligase [Candidatus Kryptonia bacterium]|nr:D-alanine--D-alanine ligase [Candidatus Kryptonia bacterium]
MSKLRVGILFGGRSSEHEISLRSARSVVQALDRSRFEPTLIGIDHRGHWHVLSDAQFLALTDATLPALTDGGPEVVLPPAPSAGELIDLSPRAPLPRLDVVFPVLHGAFGEDGTVQGLFELADIAYVGAGVLGSAVGMDKDIQKRLLRDAQIPIVPFSVISAYAWRTSHDQAAGAANALGYPVFVKPANAGSSVGVSKVKRAAELAAAITAAFAYDSKVLIEKGIDAREIECSVLGNETPEASLPGEVRPLGEFYSYEAKYVDEHGATFQIPAPLSAAQTDAVRALAIRTFQVLACEGMARVDFFLDRTSGALYVNELNSIPGFTNISVYPKLWELSGLSYRDLITRLLDLAIERHQRRRQLQTTYRPKEPSD